VNLIQDMLDACKTGDDSTLRTYPEGRAFLLECAREQRRVPLCVRRFPRIAAHGVRASVDRIVMDVLRGRIA
jgi:hypothetical protein